MYSQVESLEQSEGSGKLPHIWRKNMAKKKKGRKGKGC